MNQQNNTLEKTDCALSIPCTPVDTVSAESYLRQSSEAISVEEHQQAAQPNLRKRRRRINEQDLGKHVKIATASTTTGDTQEINGMPHEGLQNGQHTRGSSQAIQQLQPGEVVIESPQPQSQLRLHNWLAEQSRALGGLLKQILSWLWWVVKYPMLVTVAFLILLQLLALGYTFLSRAYLNSFCTKSLPYVRDWMCSEWDQMQNKQMHDVQHPFTEPVVLMHGTHIPWELPLYMTMWEVSFRDIRVNLGGSELQDSDKVFFREKINAYLELSEPTIEEVQTMFNHIADTAERTVDNTELMLQNLEGLGLIPDQGLLSGPPGPSDDLLTIGMGWLADHKLVYLPVGVEPFREFRYVYNPQLQAVLLMKAHTYSIQERLLEEIALVRKLQPPFATLARIADQSRERIMMRYSEEKKAKVVRGDQFWRWVVDRIWGTSVDRYVSNQRMTLLESMGPVYRNASEYLVFKDKALNSVRHACENLHERLSLEEDRVYQGQGVSD